MMELYLFKNRLKISIIWESVHTNHYPGKSLIEVNEHFLRGKVSGFSSI